MLNRRATRSADAESIASWFKTRAEAISWGGPKVPEPLTAAWLEQEFETGIYWVWVDGTDSIVGVFALRPLDAASARFGRFALAPSLRGQGLAKGLLQDAIALARSLGSKHVTLGVYGSNRIARRVYHRAGFQVFAERPAEEDSSEVSYEMQLNLEHEGLRFSAAISVK